MNLYLWDSCRMSKMKELYKPDWPFNSPHWSPHKSFTFWECIDIEKGNSFWLPLGSERASSLIAFYCSVKQIFLTFSWSCATIFLVVLCCFLCTSLSAGNMHGYTCMKTWHMGPKQHNRVLGTLIWAQFKGQIMLSNGEIAIQWISDSKMYSIICRIEIYLVDSVIRPSNNWSLYVGLYFI